MGNLKLQWGTQAPWFHGHTVYNPRFSFSSLAGRFVALVFLGDFKSSIANTFINKVSKRCPLFSDEHIVRFAVTLKQQDQKNSNALKAFPKQRIFYDHKGNISETYNAINKEKNEYHPYWLILDPTLRVYLKGSILEPDKFINELNKLPIPSLHVDTNIQLWAPVLLVPRVFEPEFCKKLVSYYKSGNPDPSGFMRTVDGKTKELRDPTVKRRNDISIEDTNLQDNIKHKIRTRLAPEIKKAFQFSATRIERYIVCPVDNSNDNGSVQLGLNATSSDSAPSKGRLS